jgi:hypothetical protein
MPKRPTATEEWEDEWFMGLMPDSKLLLKYIRGTCDAAGVWEPNYKLAEFRCGFHRTDPPRKIDWKAFLEELNAPPEHLIGEKCEARKQVMIIRGNKWWLIKFIPFVWLTWKVENQEAEKNVGKLTQTCSTHRPVIGLLHKHGLVDTFRELYPGVLDDVKYVPPDATVNPFTIPTLDEVRAMPEAKDLPDQELKLFFAHYDMHGWRVGGYYIKLSSALTKWTINYEKKQLSAQSPRLYETTVRDMEAQIARIKEQIAIEEKKTFRPAGTFHDMIKPEAAAEIKQLSKQIEELRQKIIKKGK